MSTSAPAHTVVHVTVPFPATKADAQRIIAGQREDAAAARAKLPEWRRHFDDLCEFIPEGRTVEVRSVLVPLLNAMGRAAALDARKFAAECFSAMDVEANRPP